MHKAGNNSLTQRWLLSYGFKVIYKKKNRENKWDVCWMDDGLQLLCFCLCNSNCGIEFTAFLDTVGICLMETECREVIVQTGWYVEMLSKAVGENEVKMKGNWGVREHRLFLLCTLCIKKEFQIQILYLETSVHCTQRKSYLRL